MTENEISKYVVNAAYRVHTELGPGLLENAYEACLLKELKEVGLNVKSQEILPVYYRGDKIELCFRLDLWVNKKVVVEIKTVSQFDPVHSVQLLTYLKLTENKLGLLINFNVPLIKDGIKRVVNNL